jgi:3,4-dihydroxy 2-butanone 4-phosphate synthase / GTP cyclohydrolase II
MARIQFSTIDEAIKDIRDGNMVIVVDDEDRENEGDFIAAAEKITPDIVNFMVTHGRGMICTPLTEERAEELELGFMVPVNTSVHGTPFTVTVDYKKGTTTGISVSDRAATIKALADPAAKPEDFARPGHIFPLRAMKGGVLRRAGHTESVVDMTRLAGLQPVGVLCEILNEDGTMARLPQLPGSGCGEDQVADEQPEEGGRVARLRSRDSRPGSTRDTGNEVERTIPASEAG